MKRMLASIAVVVLALAGGTALAQNKLGDKPGAIGEVEGTAQLPSYKLGNESPQPANRDAGNVTPTSAEPALSGSTGEKSTPTAIESYAAKTQGCRTEGEFRQNLSGNALQAFVAKCVGE